MVDGETVQVDVHLPHMKPVFKSQQTHFSLVISSLRENRLHVTSRSDDVTGHVTNDVIGQVVVARSADMSPICALNFPLPCVDDTAGREVMRMRMMEKDSEDSSVSVRLTDIADSVSNDWQLLATQLAVNQQHTDVILRQYSHPAEQVRLHNIHMSHSVTFRP